MLLVSKYKLMLVSLLICENESKDRQKIMKTKKQSLFIVILTEIPYELHIF